MRGECLECNIEDRRVAVPVEAIEQIADLAVAPAPPLAADWLRGLALHRDQIMPLVDAIGSSEGRTARVRCLVLRAEQTGFCLPVSRVLHLVQVEFADDADARLTQGRDAQGAAIEVLRPNVIARAIRASGGNR